MHENDNRNTEMKEGKRLMVSGENKNVKCKRVAWFDIVRFDPSRPLRLLLNELTKPGCVEVVQHTNQ